MAAECHLQGTFTESRVKPPLHSGIVRGERNT